MQPPPPAYNPDAGQKPPVAQAVQAMPVQAQPVIVGVPGMMALPPANSVCVTPFPPSSVQIFESATLRSARANRLPGEVRRRWEVSPGQNFVEGSHPHALHPFSILIFPPGAGRVAVQTVRGRKGWGAAEAIRGVICTDPRVLLQSERCLGMSRGTRRTTLLCSEAQAIFALTSHKHIAIVH